MSGIVLHWNSNITVECFNTNKLQIYVRECFELKDREIIKIKKSTKIEIVMKAKIKIWIKIKIKWRLQRHWDSIGKGKSIYDKKNQ